MSAQPQVWFISGASQGIGLSIAHVAAENDYIVFAGARNPSAATGLQELAANNKNVHIIKYEASSAADATAVAQRIEELAGGLDVLVPNAAHFPFEEFRPVKDTKPDVLSEHIQINAIGPILLFQALYPLMLKRQMRKFIPISSAAGSISMAMPISCTSYGASKATLNFLTKRIAQEHAEEGFIAFPLHPGTVKSVNFKAFLELTGFEIPDAMALEEAGDILFNMINNASMENSGKFMSYDGTELPW